MLREGWADNAGVRLHYVESRPAAAAGVPLLVLPGVNEAAEEYEWLLRDLAPRPVAAVSLRGRGRSDAPATGYDLADHLGDVETVVGAIGWPRFALLGHSRGSGYALGYAVAHPDRVAGLVVGDYEARHAKVPEGWARDFGATALRGVPTSERLPVHVLEGIEREAVERPFWDDLPGLPFPVLVLRAERELRILRDDTAERWQRGLAHGRVVTVPGANHNLWNRDPGPFRDLVASFLTELDRSPG